MGEVERPTLDQLQAEAWKLFKYNRSKIRRSKSEQSKRAWSLAAQRALNTYLRLAKYGTITQLEQRLSRLEEPNEGATGSEQPRT